MSRIYRCGLYCLVYLLGLGSTFSLLAAPYGGLTYQGTQNVKPDVSWHSMITLHGDPGSYTLFYGIGAGTTYGKVGYMTIAAGESSTVKDHYIQFALAADQHNMAGTSGNPPIDVSGSGGYTYIILSGYRSSYNVAYELTRDSISISWEGTLEYGDPKIGTRIMPNYDLALYADNSPAVHSGDLYDGMNDPGPSEPDPVDAEFFALGWDGSIDYEPLDPPDPAEVMEMVIEAAATPGTEITKEMLMLEAINLGLNPKIALEGVELADGDKITFKVPRQPDVEGFIETTATGEFMWTDNLTTLVNSSSYTEQVQQEDGSYQAEVGHKVTTTHITENGSFVVEHTTWDPDGAATTASTTAKLGDGQGDSLTGAEEQAGALASAAAGEAEGMAEGEAIYGEGTESTSDSLAEASGKLKEATSALETKFASYDPLAGNSLGKSTSHTITIPMGAHTVSWVLPLNHPAVVALRAVELVLVSLMGIRLFFRIMIV